jgi:hypothetical protein
MAKKSRFLGPNPSASCPRNGCCPHQKHYWSYKSLVHSYNPPMQSGAMNWASGWDYYRITYSRMTIPRMGGLGKSKGSLAGVDRCGIETSYANRNYSWGQDPKPKQKTSVYTTDGKEWSPFTDRCLTKEICHSLICGQPMGRQTCCMVFHEKD